MLNTTDKKAYDFYFEMSNSEVMKNLLEEEKALKSFQNLFKNAIKPTRNDRNSTTQRLQRFTLKSMHFYPKFIHYTIVHRKVTSELQLRNEDKATLRVCPTHVQINLPNAKT